MKHTKEPWGVGRPSPNGQQVIGNGKGMMIAIANPTSTQGEVNANAERIVACVNACAGIRTEAIESGLIKYLLNDAYMRTLNPLLPNPQRKQDMTYLGKPVYEEDFEEVENEEE